jgi:prepilin-type N-terminal cleavage/methylation domain-containing protein
MFPRRGFTLWEVLVSICIGLTLLSAATLTTYRFLQNRQLETVSNNLVSYLRTAEARALQSEGNSSHGVSLTSGKLTLFQGASYSARTAAYDVVWIFPSYITYSGISEVVFAKQTGTPSVSGTVTVTNGIKSNVVTIYSTGAISR